MLQNCFENIGSQNIQNQTHAKLSSNPENFFNSMKKNFIKILTLKRTPLNYRI